MGIIPDRYISELSRSLKKRKKAYDETPMSGWLALSPLFVFLCLYLVSSIIANDFYRIPISAAFLLSDSSCNRNKGHNGAHACAYGHGYEARGKEQAGI